MDGKYIDFFHSIGIEVLLGYGISECSPVVACNTIRERKIGTVGKVLDDRFVSLKIDDGEICVRGRIVSPGYYKDDESNEESYSAGWFKTGDIGHIDAEGFLHITGRKKNLIILQNGENVSPEYIEKDILKSNLIEECIVYEGKTSKGVAYIEAKVVPSPLFLEAKMEKSLIFSYINKINAKNPSYMRIGNVIISENKLKKNAMGKVIRE